MSCKLNLTKRQLYCLSRLIHLKPDEPSFYEKRYHLWTEENQPAKACNDLLALCKLTHDVVDYLPALYELCCQLHREQEVMLFLDSEYNTMIARLSRSLVVFFTFSHSQRSSDRHCDYGERRRDEEAGVHFCRGRHRATDASSPFAVSSGRSVVLRELFHVVTCITATTHALLPLLIRATPTVRCSCPLRWLLFTP